MDLAVYPIGEFECPCFSEIQLKDWIADLKTFCNRLRSTVATLDDVILDSPYRNGAWSIRQLIHHIADSHTHSYVRFKWTMTENNPLIKAYDENAWSALSDVNAAPIELSLVYLEALYAKWIYFLETLSVEDFRRTYVHPEGMIDKTLFCTLGSYVWHGNHHLAQIKQYLAFISI